MKLNYLRGAGETIALDQLPCEPQLQDCEQRQTEGRDECQRTLSIPHMLCRQGEQDRAQDDGHGAEARIEDVGFADTQARKKQPEAHGEIGQMLAHQHTA